MDKLLFFLPEKILNKIENIEKVEEIRIRMGKKVNIKYVDKDIFIDVEITKHDIENILEIACRGSVYSYQNEFVNGFITIENGIRIGITGNVVSENGNIINITEVSSLNIRVSRQIDGVSKILDKYIVENDYILNTLIVSMPGKGKTTILKDLIKRISNGKICSSKNIAVVDERMELSANNEIDLGDKTDVLTNVSKYQGMKMLVRSMAPEVIAVDEIGTKEDVLAIKYMYVSGVKGIFTAHGKSIEDIYLNPILKELIDSMLIERIIFLSLFEKGKIDSVYKKSEKGYVKCD